MAKDPRITVTTRRWHYKGQTKVHEVPIAAARTHEHGDVADEFNEQQIEAIKEYADACERGVAVVLPDSE